MFRVALVVLALAVAGTLARDGRGVLSEEEVTATAREAAAALEAATGLTLRQTVPIVLLDARAAAARRSAWTEAHPDETGITVAVDVMADLVFSDNMLGRYLPDEKVVYVLEDVLLDTAGSPALAREMLFPLLAHELVHAYDDQVHGIVPGPEAIAEALADPAGMADLQSLMGLLEGRATYLAELAAEHAGVRKLPAFTLSDARSARVFEGDGTLLGDTGADLGNVVARLKITQYAQGREFAARAFRFGGEAFFEQVFAHLPLSLAELADFDLFVRRWASEVEARLDEEAASGQAAAAPTGAGAR